jgi:hypothetical protein
MTDLMQRMLNRARAKAAGDNTSWVTVRTVSVSYYPASGTHTWWNREGPISATRAAAELGAKKFTVIFREHYGDVYEIPVWSATWHHAIRRALAILKIQRDDVILCHNGGDDA